MDAGQHSEGVGCVPLRRRWLRGPDGDAPTQILFVAHSRVEFRTARDRMRRWGHIRLVVPGMGFDAYKPGNHRFHLGRTRPLARYFALDKTRGCVSNTVLCGLGFSLSPIGPRYA